MRATEADAQAVFLASLPTGEKGRPIPGHTTWDDLGLKGKERYLQMAQAALDSLNTRTLAGSVNSVRKNAALIRRFCGAGQDDIGGGCGQLHFVQQWFKEHPELARPSVGNGLPVVHTPGGPCVTA